MPSTRPQDVGFYSTAPVHFSATRTLPATPDEVFAALADTPSWPQWFAALTKAEWTSDAPYGVGSTRRVHIGPIKVDERFIVWEPGVRWGFTFTATTIPTVRAGAELVELAPVGADGQQTEATYHMHLDPLPGLGPVTRLLRGGIEQSLGGALDALGKRLASA